MPKKKKEKVKEELTYEVALNAATSDIEFIVENVKFTPTKANPNDAGIDLYSSRRVIIPTNTQKIIPTGVKMNIPNGYRGVIKDRSSVASIRTLGVKAGVIDAGYQGEIGIVMFNYGRAPETIDIGTKIAQMKIEINPTVVLTQVDEFTEDTDRGEKGFGSSDK